MSSLVFHIQKVKGGFSGLQKHNQREMEEYKNDFINPEKTYLNYDLVNTEKINYHEKVNKIVADGYSSKRKIRDNTVKLTESIISSDEEFFKKLNPEETKKYFETTVDYFSNRFGKNNIAYANIHLDETTPHIHLGIVPITKDGRLCAKELLTPKSLREIHTELAETLKNQGFDIERGQDVKGRNVTHKSVDQFKIEKAKEIQELQQKCNKRINELNNRVDNLYNAANPPEGKTLLGKEYYTKEQYQELFSAYRLLRDSEVTTKREYNSLKSKHDNAIGRVRMLKESNTYLNKDNVKLKNKLNMYENALNSVCNGNKELVDKLLEKQHQKLLERPIRRNKDVFIR